MTQSIARLLLALAFASGFAFTAHAASAEMHGASQRLVERAAKSSDQNKARKLYEQAIVADPANADALSGLAHFYVAANKPAIARKYFNTTLFVDPVNVKALGGLGLLDVADGKLEAAQEHYSILKTVCAACSETRALAAKLNATLKASPTDKPSPTDKK